MPTQLGKSYIKFLKVQVHAVLNCCAFALPKQFDLILRNWIVLVPTHTCNTSVRRLRHERTSQAVYRLFTNKVLTVDSARSIAYRL